MADAVAWIPDQFEPIVSAFPTGAVTDEIDLRSDVQLQDEISVRRVLEPSAMAIEWLTSQVRDSVEGEMSVREIIAQGRELDTHHVLQIRSGRGIAALNYAGPSRLMGQQLIQLAETQLALTASDADLQNLRFRARLQALELDRLLIEYVATEFIDPQIMDSSIALILLAHADQLMPAELVLSIGLARAHMDEFGRGSWRTRKAPDYMQSEFWHLADLAWTANLDEEVGKKANLWAEDTVAKSRRRQRFN